MKRAVFIFIVFISMSSYGQEAKVAYQDVMESFVKYYNTKNYQAIFDMCDSNMQKAVPLISFKQQLDGLHTQIGTIKAIKFIAEGNNGRHVFKVDHEKSPLEYNLQLNNEKKIIGLRPTPYIPRETLILERNVTKMIWPFKEETFVFWGGTTENQNYHVSSKNQQYAYDIIMMDNQLPYKGDVAKNENYFIFGKNIIAPCDAKVVKVISGVHDNIPGEMNKIQLTGNSIVLETLLKEYILFAHLKKASITVKEGQMVSQGDIIAQCGNSGNSSMAHLHLSLQNHIHMSKATGAKMFFDKVIVNGQLKSDYIPVKEDFVKNLKK